MCGIAGYIGKKRLDAERLDRCLDLMRRRGPDARGLYAHKFGDGRVCHLLHSRLSIIDLDARANQPFRIGSKIIVFNGEIYNYIELREELAAAGDAFRTASDTETLLQALMRFGWQGLDKCEGMWAFAIYDETDGSLTLSRDRFGEKPLYLYRSEDGIYFGSEVKFLAQLSGRRFQPDMDQVYRYLVNGYKSICKKDRTFHEGIVKLPPGAVLIIDAAGNESIQKYWEPAVPSPVEMTFHEAAEGVRERLMQAVKIRLRADQPLAFCMSGGVDSNSLIAIAKKIFDYDVHGFTIVNKDARYEESEFVDCAVKELGLRHTEVSLASADFLGQMEILIRQHDGPVCTVSYFVHWMLIQKIAEAGYRISISGTAADELFTGYYDHHLQYLYEMRGDPDFEQALANWQNFIDPLVRNPALKDPGAYIESPDRREHIYEDAVRYAGFLKKEWRESFEEEHYTESLLRNRMMNELFHEAVPNMLHADDLNAMHFSVENRSPFLDRRLFEFSAGIPVRHLVQEGRAKAVLREAMKGIVPDRILENRRKVGFNAPLFDLLDARNPEARERLLDGGLIFEHVSREKIEALLKQNELTNSESKFLFNFINAKLFLEASA